MRKTLKYRLRGLIIIFATAVFMIVPYTSLAGTCYYADNRRTDTVCHMCSSGEQCEFRKYKCPNGWQIGTPVTNLNSYENYVFARGMQSCGGGNDHAEDMEGLSTWGVTVTQFVPTSCKVWMSCYYRNKPSGWCNDPAHWSPRGNPPYDYLVTANCSLSLMGQVQNPTPAITVVNGRSFSITLYNSSGFSTASTSYGTISVSTSGSNQILSGTLNGVPSDFVDVNLGSGKIKLKAIQPPNASAARVSFY